MTFFFPFNWTNKTFIQLGIIVFFLLVGTTLWVINIIKEGVKEDIQNQLQSIQQATHETMHYWMDMNIEAAINIANRETIKTHISQLIKQNPNPATLRKNLDLMHLRNELIPFITQHEYKGFFIISHNQINYGSMRDDNLGKKNLLLRKDSRSLLQAFAGETVLSKPVITDTPIEDEQGVLQTNQYSMFVITPILNNNNKIIALLMFRINPADNFKKILQVGKIGKSGETYVINKSGLLLSPSRFDKELIEAGIIKPNTSSTYQLTLKEPIRNITLGYRPNEQYDKQPLTNVVRNIIKNNSHEELKPDRDYRGVKVINIGRWDADEGFGFISQIDYQEAFSVYLTTRNTILITTGIIGLLLTILVTSLINSRQVALRLVKKRTSQLKQQNKSLQNEVDERKKIQKSLQTNQLRTEAILQSAFDAIIATDKQGYIELVNPATEAMFGYKANELIGKNIKILIPNTIRKHHDDFIKKYHKGMKSNFIGHRREMVACRKDGTTFPIELALEEKTINGELCFTSTINNITEQKIMMERISASEKEYKSIINNLNDTFYRTDTEGNIVMVSPSAEKLLGYCVEELVGLQLSNLHIMPDSRNKFLSSLKKHNGSLTDYEVQLRRKDGVEIWIATNIHVYNDEHGSPLGIEGTARDITAKKMTEEEIRESRQRLSFHIKQTPLGVIEWDIHFKVVEWNPAAEHIFGYKRNEAIGRHASDLVIPKEIKPHIDDIWHSLLDQHGGQQSINKNITKQGETIWCEWHNTPLVDGNMNVIGIASMIMDNTSRKKAEEILTRDHEQLRALVEERTTELNSARIEAEQANESKSNFLANMSHELRTPIHTILSFAEMGIKKSDKLSKEKINHFFTNIHQGGERQLLLLNDLLDLSKLEAGTTSYDFNENDIHHVIKEQISQHEFLLKKKHLKIKIEPCQIKTQLIFDRIRIEQVIRNLLSNAIKFSEPKSMITINIDKGEIHSEHEMIPGLTITISDQGIGIPEDELESIFDKFIQSSKTRTGAGGTGLGLAICQEIISTHNGKIWAQNNDTGASFFFTLPLQHIDKTEPE